MTIDRGGVRAIVGRSGSGKTTLLMCLGRFLRPQSGSITVDGRDLGEIRELDLRQVLGIVFQELHLFPHMTVLENLTLAPVHALRQEADEARERALGVMGRLGIEELAESFPSQISGGQAQRAAIGRALLLEPSYLLLDEPTSALDVRTSREFGRWLIDLHDVTTFIIVTHDTVFAREVANSAVLLEGGRVRAEGAVDDVLERLERTGD
jgi:ABC-type polar amino acid transport system ATPase subunit